MSDPAPVTAYDGRARAKDALSDDGSASVNSSGLGEIKQTGGVDRMEAIARAAEGRRGRNILIGVGIAIYICNWVSAMQSSTTFSYAIWATSGFGQHSSGLASLNIATGIISSVCLPFLAKFSDVFARSWVYAFSLIAYVVGFVIIAFSPTLTAYIVGSVLVAVGEAAISLLNTILCGDLVPLKYRGLAQGLLSTPYLATVWYTSSIAQALGTDKNWRWGYGMYCIIMPVVMGPAILVILYLERKARQQGLSLTAAEPIEDSTAQTPIVDDEEKKPDVPQQPKLSDLEVPRKTATKRLIEIWHELDSVGLILLGFGWSLLLLPFSLSAYANDGYRNPSLIAMFVVGGLCLVFYGFWEIFFAKFPTAPKRLFKNRTFITAIIIDFIYLMAGYMNLTYIYSYVWIVTDYDDRQQNIYNNILTLGLCSCGVAAGLWHRFTHRYKAIQLFGLCIKIIGYAMVVSPTGVRSEARLILCQVLAGIGGAFSVVGSQVGSQASVPHQDLALVISLLTLWTNIGAAIGSAIAAAVWEHNMPLNLRKYLPASVTEQEIAGFFGSITLIKEYPYDSEVRQGAIRAYGATVYPLFAGALGLSFISLIAGFFQTNFYLGDQQNAVTNTDTAGRKVAIPAETKPKTMKERLLRFWDM